MLNAVDFLRTTYPGQYLFTAEQVAKALGKKGTRGAIQEVSKRMREGDLARAGAKRQDGRLVLPLPILAGILDPALPAPTLPSNARVGARRAMFGHRIALIRNLNFWRAVAKISGLTGEAENFEQVALEVTEMWRAEEIVVARHRLAEKLAIETSANKQERI